MIITQLPLREQIKESLEKRGIKLLRKYKRSKRNLKTLLRTEIREAACAAFAFSHTQLKIRPRARLFSKIIIILALAYFASDRALAYVKPREADIKINGQAILVAENKPAGQNIDAVEISQSVVSKRSPFDFEPPVDHGYISQGYSFYHRANDIATDLGTSIHPVGSGVVSYAGFTSDGKGNEVIVDHGDGLETLYAHMGKIYVGTGNTVSNKTILGTVGLTGRTTGPHVHFEVYDHGVTVDPASMLKVSFEPLANHAIY